MELFLAEKTERGVQEMAGCDEAKSLASMEEEVSVTLSL